MMFIETLLTCVRAGCPAMTVISDSAGPTIAIPEEVPA